MDAANLTDERIRSPTMSSAGDEVASSELVRSHTHVMNTTLSFVSSMSLKCAVELGIPDAIHRHGRPIRLPNLTAALSLPPARSPSLGRLMRALEHAGFFARHPDGEGGMGYVLTPSSSFLRDRESAYVRAILDPAMMAPFLHLSSWFRKGEPTSFESTHGMSLWEYAGEHPEFSALFNAAMAQDSELATRRIVAKCGGVFDGIRSVVDVGGGNGSVSRAIAEAFPHLRCTVLDLPHAVAASPATERVVYVGGSMFDDIPPADAVLLKRVLHDYDDEDCLKVLRKCKEVIPSKEEGGKLILVDIVLNVVDDVIPKSLETQILYDMMMMTLPGGKERDEQEWQKIFIEAGFSSYKITLILGYLSLIEVYP